MLKAIVQYKLKILSRLIIKKYQPEIIGITGSTGKTSTREAVYTVLSAKYKVRQNIKNYNNEIGLPLSIIGANSPGKSFSGWIKVFIEASRLIIIKDKDYPRILVLEMGVDRPGDMAYLKTIVNPKIAIITLIGPVHMEYFGTIENIEKEKNLIIKDLPAEGWVILNYDDERVKSSIKSSKSKTLTFGFDEKADVRASEVVFSFEETKNIGNLIGINFKLSYKGSTVPVLLPKVIGYPAIYSALAAAAVAITYDQNLIEISQSLRKLKSPPGRMNLISGINRTMIIDDTYNSSPQPCISALSILGKIPLMRGAKKIAVLGDMAELGSYSQEGHEEVGKAVAKNKINYLIVVGKIAAGIAKGAISAGMSENNIFKFSTADEAKIFLKEKIRQDDLILVKGSQSMRMEKVVEEIMADRSKAKDLLVRQDWQDEKNKTAS